MSGYSGSSYDRYVERTDKSTLHKMKETFWTTKQAVIQKLGKKEDVHVVASDAELDAKLEVFKAIQVSSMELLRVIEKYQDRLCALSQHENSMGRFLKSQSNIDKTRAGKMMAAVGKSQSFSAQQRLALRVPLVRLYQEVETFRYRAISDTLMTINRMEGARTEYRGALLWMKNVSEELDPDTYKQLEKFRKVQAQVKKTKTKFDKLKLDVMQKVDLLAASRCNMFSHVLANYQSALLHFWEKTSRTLTAVAESFKGYQYYEFSIIKELAEPSKQLAEKSSRVQPQRDTDEDFDPSNLTDSDDSVEERPNVKGQSESTSLIDIVTSSDSEEEEDSQDSTGEHCNHDDTSGSQRPQVKGVLEGDPKGHSTQVSEDEQLIDIGSSSNDDRLLELDEESSEKQQAPKDSDSMHNLYESETDEKSKNEGDPELFLEFEEDEDFDFTGKALPLSKTPASEKDKKAKDLLADDLHLEADDTGKDDMTILNEILNAPSTGEDDFTKEWQAVFGNVPIATGTTYTPVESDQSSQSAEFMPSNLLDISKAMASMSVADNPPSEPSKGQLPSGGKGQQVKPKSKKEEKKDMSAWFNLFADLDPLSNPDAIGKKPADMTDA